MRGYRRIAQGDSSHGISKVMDADPPRHRRDEANVPCPPRPSDRCQETSWSWFMECWRGCSEPLGHQGAHSEIFLTTPKSRQGKK